MEKKLYISVFILIFSISINGQKIENSPDTVTSFPKVQTEIVVSHNSDTTVAVPPITDFSVKGADYLQTTEEQTNTKKKKNDKNFKFSILGGPGYSPDYGFSIGLSTLMTFRTVKSDTSLMKSVIPINVVLSFGKPIGITVLTKPLIYFKDDKIRLQGLYEFKHTGENYYGVGYSDNHNTPRGKDITGYNANLIQINPVLLFRIKESCYIGPTADFYFEDISNPGEFVLNDPYYIRQGGTAEGMTDRNVGLGVAFSYDTRDMAANAYSGFLFEARALGYTKYLGGEYNFGSVTLDYRQYVQFSKKHRRVLAWNILAKSRFGDVPFSQYAQVGGPYTLRGYYLGQYRDHTAISTEVEWRHMWDIKQDTKIKRLLHRLGYAAWAGCGFLGPTPIKYDAILPNLGGGLRVEVQKRMNFRVDAGYSFANKHALFYFNMTEAF